MKSKSEEFNTPPRMSEDFEVRNLRRRMWKAFQQDDAETALRAYQASHIDLQSWIEEEQREKEAAEAASPPGTPKGTPKGRERKVRKKEKKSLLKKKNKKKWTEIKKTNSKILHGHDRPWPLAMAIRKACRPWPARAGHGRPWLATGWILQFF